MSVTAFVGLFESLLLPNCLRYQNMNGTMLSQIVWNMFLANHCLPKVDKNCQKKKKGNYRVYCTGSDDIAVDDSRYRNKQIKKTSKRFFILKIWYADRRKWWLTYMCPVCAKNILIFLEKTHKLFKSTIKTLIWNAFCNKFYFKDFVWPINILWMGNMDIRSGWECLGHADDMRAFL